MSLRQKLSNIFSPFNGSRLLLIILSLLVAVLIGLMVHFFFFSKIKQKNNFDTKTLCLYDGASNGVMIFIDQTAALTAKQAKGIERRVKKIANDQVDQFGRLTFYILTRDNHIKKIGFVCNPGNLNKIEDDWVDILGMKKKQIFNYYKSQAESLTRQAMDGMTTKPAAESRIMEGMRDAIMLYKTAGETATAEVEANQEKELEKNNASQASTQASTQAPAPAMILPEAESLDWLIVFSDMKEHRPDFSLRTATAKTTPNILDFWAKNEVLKSDLSHTAVGVYYFKDKKEKSNKKNTKDTLSADDNNDDENFTFADDAGNATADNNKKKNKKINIKEKRNNKFRKFWEDYWQSQGATVEWFRGIE